MRIFLIALVILSFSFLSYADSSTKLVKPLIYNEEALTEQLKGQTKEEVVRALGEPAVKKPSNESEGNLEYWWYNLPEAGIFVYFTDGRIYVE